jgi:hypothetical protein
MVKIVFTYVAVKPITAEHPVGSGKIVSYQPGDVIPAGEWGRAADNLVERGKAAMMAVNVLEAGDMPEGGSVGDATPAELAAEDDEAFLKNADDESSDDAAELEEADMSEFPTAGRGGWYTLSDGSRVRGHEAAVEAEANLGGGE